VRFKKRYGGGKRVAWNLGKHHSKETKEKISKSGIIRGMNSWTKEDILFLENNYKIKSDYEIARKLKCSAARIFRKRIVLNLIKSREDKRYIRSNARKGSKNPFFGKKWGIEARKKISETRKRKFHEGILKPSRGFTGRKHTEEYKKIMSHKIKKFRKTQILPFKDSTIELKIQKFLSQLHIEFFTHKYISEITHGYQCDILVPVQEGISQKTIIECDGCFFHACPICKLKEYYWTVKRRELDKLRTQELKEKGYRVIRLWEHDIRKMELNKFKYSLYNL